MMYGILNHLLDLVCHGKESHWSSGGEGKVIEQSLIT